MLLNVWLFGSCGLLSSASWELEGLRPPPAVKEKFCPVFLGLALFTTTRLPRFLFVNVQVTVSPAEMLMFVIGLPSLQVALDWSHPEGTVSAIEYPPPGVTLL